MDAFETKLKKINKKIDSVIDKLSIGNSRELTKDFDDLELRCLVGALSSKLAAHNLFITDMKIRYLEWSWAIDIIKKLYEKHLEIGLYSDLNYLWEQAKKLLEHAQTAEERTSCAQDSAPEKHCGSAIYNSQQPQAETPRKCMVCGEVISKSWRCGCNRLYA